MAKNRDLKLFSFKHLTQSAKDFTNIVWPLINSVPIVGGGEIIPVEANSEKDFSDILDLVAGIDAWQHVQNPSSIKGIASRVQWGNRYDSFSIRTATASGGETEFQKRIRAINHEDEGCLYPYLTIQAFLDSRGGNFLSAGAIKTKKLFSFAEYFYEEGYKEDFDDREAGFRTNPDGSKFMFLTWDFLIDHNVMDIRNIVCI